MDNNKIKLFEEKIMQYIGLPSQNIAMYVEQKKVQDSLNLLNLKGNILEVGSNIGIITDFLHKRFPLCNIDSIEIDLDIVNLAKELYPSYNFIQGDIYEYFSQNKNTLFATEYDYIIVSRLWDSFEKVSEDFNKLFNESSSFIKKIIIILPLIVAGSLKDYNQNISYTILNRDKIAKKYNGYCFGDLGVCFDKAIIPQS